MSSQTISRYLFSVIRERMHNHPRPVLDFAVGDELRREHPEALAELLRSGAQGSTKRGSRAEADEFSAAVVDYMRREYGVSLGTEAVLPAPGGRYALTAFASCALEPGDGAFVTEPGYPVFSRVAAHHHARLVVASLDPDRGFSPDFEAIPEAEAAAVRLVALNYPNNPSGAVLPDGIAAESLRRFGPETVLFNDAAYGPLTYEGHSTSLLVDSPKGTNVLELHTLGKLFALGPLGAAFLVGSGPLLEKLKTFTEFAWSPLSSFHMQVATLCLRDPAFLAEVRQFFQGRISRLRETLSTLGFEPYPTPAGLYVLCGLPSSADGDEMGTAQEAAELLLDRFDLATVPWDIPPHGYLRFTALYRDEDLDSLAALGDRLQLASRRDS